MSNNLTKQEDVVYSGTTNPHWDMLASKAGGMFAVETGSMLTGEAGGMLAVETGSTLTGEAGSMLASEARGMLDEKGESPETDRDTADMVKRIPAKTNDKLQVYCKNSNSLP